MGFAASMSNEEIEKLPFAAFGGEIVVVDNAKGHCYAHAIEYLAAQKVLGFDTETKPCFVARHPRNMLALLQLSGPDKAFLFRLPKTGIPQELAAILADERILKIGAAVDDDVAGLRKYNDFSGKGFVDLQTVVAEYGIEQKSVKRMAAIILGVRISKSQQLSNWESAVLSSAQQRYAATDAWICLQMWNKLLALKK